VPRKIFNVLGMDLLPVLRQKNKSGENSFKIAKGGVPMTEESYRSEWFEQTVAELRRYRVLKKRVEVIEVLLRKQCGPDARAIANYGINTYGSTNPDEISRLEVELEEKQTQLQAIEKSLETLGEREKRIIELKFKHGHCDKRIYKLELPMSQTTFYGYYNEAITEIAKCLGYLGC
jgi:DNA-directed RNA polymerase specialized sigma subunit